jgi:putative ABC transport system permease protein
MPFRVAARSLFRARGFTVAAVVTLALAIGANTMVFSAVEAVLLHPLPVRAIDELVTIESGIPGMSMDHLPLATAEVYDLAERRDLFRGVAGYRMIAANLTGSGAPQRVSAIATIGPLFDVLGVRPYAGRFYTSQNIEGGDKHVVVLSYDFWQMLTGGDPASIGKTLRLDGQTYTLIGVLPPGLQYPLSVQLWTPQPPFPGFDARTNRCCRMVTTVARLRAGVQLDHVRAELAAQMAAWRRESPQVYAIQSGAGSHAQSMTAIPLANALAGSLRPILFLLLGAAAFVLLIACANVASLHLVRTIGRSREIAVRSAIGASRATIAGHSFVESFLIAAAAGVLGVAGGAAGVAAVVRTDAWQSAVTAPLSLDWRVCVLSGILTIAVAILAGVAPSIHAVRVSAGDLLGSATRGATDGHSQNHFLRLAVVGQVALSLVLLLGCSLALRSLDKLLRVDPGFRPENVMRMRLALSGAHYAQNPAKTVFVNELLDQLRRTPGVVAAGTVSGGPFSQLKPDEQSMLVKAIHDGAPSGADMRATVWIVGGDYFNAMRIPVRDGRTFGPADNVATPRVWLTDEALARQLFPGERAIDKHIEWQPPFPTIVGVVGSVKKSDLAAPDEPSLYWSYQQYPQAEMAVVVRSTLGSAVAGPMMRQAVRDLDPSLPVFDLMPVEQSIAKSVGPRRLASGVLVAFALLSLSLAVLGMYAVLSYTTARRTKEIGIRLALGANAGDVVRGVVRNAVLVACGGIIIGVALFMTLGHILSSLVFGISPRDPVTMTIGVAIVMTVAVAASVAPARRASTIDLIEALRKE